MNCIQNLVCNENVMKDMCIHLPVMVDKVIDYLVWKKDGVYVDATLGCGGHTLAILQNSNAFVLGFDLDVSQVEIASERLSEFKERSLLVLGNYKDMDWFLDKEVDGILFDLGLSSYQLNNPERGFSYRKDGPLDMRYGKQGMTAADIVEGWNEEEIADILYHYGDERFSRIIGKKIKREKPETTGELALLVRKSVPRAKGHKHLAKVFQALRIAVNDEFRNIEEGIVVASKILKKRGRLVVITYHREEEKLVCKKAREENLKRCRSAHLRVFEK
jgi:16S rRNA (cytosine1402-N4)-methyltransferase